MAISVRMQRAIHRAADMKAAGSSWEMIAAELQRTVQRVKKWPRVYAIEWQELFGKFEKQFLEEAAAESVLALRKQLRVEAPLVSVQAAEKLIRYRISRAKPTPKPAAKSNKRRNAEERERQFANELDEEARRAAAATRVPTTIEAT